MRSRSPVARVPLTPYNLDSWFLVLQYLLTEMSDSSTGTHVWMHSAHPCFYAGGDSGTYSSASCFCSYILEIGSYS